jgi:hypothetical protein
MNWKMVIEKVNQIGDHCHFALKEKQALEFSILNQFFFIYH